MINLIIPILKAQIFLITYFCRIEKKVVNVFDPIKEFPYERNSRFNDFESFFNNLKLQNINHKPKFQVN